MPETVLIVDDDANELRHLESLVRRSGHVPVMAGSGEEALARLESGESFAAVILDLVMPDLDGMAVLSRLRGRAGVPPIVVQATAAGIDAVSSALKAGASDFIVRPAGVERVAAALGNAIRIGALRKAVLDRPPQGPADGLEALATASPPMLRARELGLRAARSGLPVLVTGESGTGKRRFAHAVHAAGDRSDRLPVTTRGAAGSAALRSGFDEARARQTGLILTDVDALGADDQEWLARRFDSGLIGFSAAASGARRQVRLLATTRFDLAEKVRAGVFRDDLYMRLAVQPIPLPALRHRPEDLADLALRFALRASAETGRPVRRLSIEAEHAVLAHAWPGNLRELDIVMHRAVMLAEGDEIEPAHLPALCGLPAPIESGRFPRVELPEAAPVPTEPDFVHADGRPRTLAEIEAEAIRRALDRAAGHVGRAAKDLGIGRSTLYRKAHELGLVADRFETLLGDAA